MAVGQEIVCYCSSCKLELRHVIVAHKSGNSGTIAKVKCNTCFKIHAFRHTPGVKAEGATKKVATPRVKAQVIPVEVEWKEALSKTSAANTPYLPTKEFKSGDVIDHAQFGCGVVRSMKDGNKMEVLFQHDVKTLVHKLKED